MKTDFTEIQKNYKGLWIALNESLDEVISSGKKAKEVYNKAIKMGHKKPTLFKVPHENLPYFGGF